ncbi:MAG: hypothetical protein FWD06_09965 [Oscillospiraceae bacterium]|nr:hypothetical protein [Oscillospiraceae bacterium]
MKKFNHPRRPLALLLALLLLGLALPFTPALASPGPDISASFECEVFETAVRFRLFLMPDEPIPAGRVANEITVWDLSRRGITSLAGIEHFSNLRVLDVSGNALTTANFSQNAELRQVDVSNNPLTSLNVTQNAHLVALGAGGTQLQSLDLSGNTALDFLWIPTNPQLHGLNTSNNPQLEELIASGSGLRNLNLANNPNLHTLMVADNELISLTLNNHPQLFTLDVSRNYLDELDVTGSHDLTVLLTAGNRLTSLNVAQNSNLVTLIATDNQLQNLNVTQNPRLRDLRVNNNQIGVIDTTENPLLHRLEAANNRLSSIDVAHNEPLTTLNLAGNEIAAIDLSYNLQLHTVNVSHNRLDSLDVIDLTRLRDLDVSYNAMPSQQAIAGLNTAQLINFIYQPQFPVGTDIVGAIACENLLVALRTAMNLGADSPILAEQAALVTHLNLFNQGITRIDGLQYFSALERVNLAYNHLTHADFTMLPSLREVDVSNNDLISLHVSDNSNLERLWASRNHLETLNLQDNPHLHTLDVAGNLLASLDLRSNGALTTLNASRNMLTGVDLRTNAALRTLDVRYNFMTVENAAPLHPQAFITTFRFHPQHGSNHDVSAMFACANFLAAVRDYLDLDATEPVTPANLQQIINLDVSGQGITSLAGLSFMTNLQRLYAANNTVASVDMTNNQSLTYLDVRGNWLESREAITGLRVGVLLRFDPQAFNGRNITAQFACENFLAAVREAMGLAAGAQIGAGDALTVIELNLAGRSITNTAGIANFANLATLNLANNPLRHIDLSQNIALQNLNVSGACLNILNLQHNINLTQLQASQNHLTALNLTTNTQLQSVDARQNFMENTAAIQFGSTPTVQFSPQHSRVVVAPTCTVRGFTAWTSTCGHTMTTNETAPLGHVFTSVVTPPTFTQRGFTTRTCTRCDYSYTANSLPPVALDYAPTLTLRHRQATTLFSDIAQRFPELTWHSSSPEVMDIDELGQVSYGRAPRRGTTTITAVCAEGVVRMEVEVTVRLAWWQWIIIVAFFGWWWY